MNLSKPDIAGRVSPDSNAQKPILEGIGLSKHFAVESCLLQPKKPPV